MAEMDESTSHSAHASSSSRPFDLTIEHPLIKTVTVKSDPQSVDWNKLDLRYSQLPRYDLEKLLTHAHFRPAQRKRISLNEVKRSGDKPSRESHAIAWVWHLIHQHRLSTVDDDLACESDLVVPALEEGLVPFTSSLNNRPDGVILRAFRCNNGNWKLPCFMSETHSSPYKNTVTKTAVDVLDQFRLLRCFNADIRECIGFAFPKYDEESFVTKVIVSFSSETFTFVVRLFPLPIDKVEGEVVCALRCALSHQYYDPVFCFIRFSGEELRKCRQALRSEQVTQYPTKHSILLKGDAAFWKYIPRLIEKENVLQLYGAFTCKPEPRHITLHRRVAYIQGKPYYEFPAHLPPLRKEDVGNCLCDFMMRTATALLELHRSGFAHLDVRIPNICFAKEGGTYIVKLIDLDRSTTDGCFCLDGYSGEMYKGKEGWTTTQYDWKQLGLLAAGIIFKCSHADLVEHAGVLADKCLKSLIGDGEWSEELCRKSSNVLDFQREKLDTILDRRFSSRR